MPIKKNQVSIPPKSISPPSSLVPQAKQNSIVRVNQLSSNSKKYVGPANMNLKSMQHVAKTGGCGCGGAKHLL